MRLFVVFLLTLYIMAVGIMDGREIDIHEYSPVRRILFQFTDSKVHLIGGTVLIRAAKSRQPVTFIEITGKYPSDVIPFTEKADSADTDGFITDIGQALYECSFFKSITALRRYAPRAGLKREKKPLPAAQHMGFGR